PPSLRPARRAHQGPGQPAQGASSHRARRLDRRERHGDGGSGARRDRGRGSGGDEAGPPVRSGGGQSRTAGEDARGKRRARRRSAVEAGVTGSRPLRVLHLTAVETSNYYLNNLARFTPPGEVRLLAVTLGRRGSFVTDLEALDVRAWALGAVRRWSYPGAVLRLWRL